MNGYTFALAVIVLCVADNAWVNWLKYKANKNA